MDYEVTMQFPMETGLPVIFNLKSPTLFSLKGHATASTEFDYSDKSPLPNSAVITGKAQIVPGLNVQRRLLFTTPFEGQEYIIGKDKNLQILLPIRGKVEYDMDKREAKIKIQVDDENQEYKVLQFEKQSFTTRRDVSSLQPVTKNNNKMHVTYEYNVTNSQTNAKDWGDKRILQFQWKTSSTSGNDEIFESMWQRVLEAARRFAQSIVTIVYPNKPETFEYETFSVTFYPSSVIAAEMKISHDIAEDDNELQNPGNSPPNAKVPFLEENLNQRERKQKILKQASKEINSVKAEAIDVNLKLIGGTESSVNITAATGISEVDERSRTLLYATARMNDNNHSYFLTFGMEAKNPNVGTLDYKKTLEANTPREYKVEILYGLNDGKNDADKSKIEIKGKMGQSEDRKNRIRQSRDAQLCNQDNSTNGNIMTSICQKVNRRATSVDEGEYTIICKNEHLLKPVLMHIVNPSGKIFQKQFEIKINEHDIEDSDRVKVVIQLASNNETIYGSFKTSEGEVQSKNIESSSDYKNDGQKNYENLHLLLSITSYTTCSLDKTQVKTFDQHHYSVQLGKCWHVVMTSYPKNDPDIPGQKKEIPDNMLVSVLARENNDERKEIKITIGDREVLLLPSDSHQTQAKVNGNDINYSKNKSHQDKENSKVIFELYRLADDSTKLVSEKYSVKITYDGFRARVEAGERYRDSVRGLCGDNDAEPENDKISPKGCLLQQSEEFAATYALVESEQCEGPARQNAAKAKKSPCADQAVRPGNVISEKEAGRQTPQNSENEEDDAYEDLRCTRYRTLVDMSETQICFSTRPIFVCSPTCSPRKVITRSIHFHCIDRTSAAEKVAEQIEQGADPELSQGKVSRTEDREIPFGCKP